MDSRETRAFAERLMLEVWEPLDAEAVPRFTIASSNSTMKTWCIAWWRTSRAVQVRGTTFGTSSPRQTSLQSAFCLGATGPSGQSISAEANYFYHLKDDKVSEFWLLAGRQLARLLLISSIAFDPKRTRVLS